MYSIIVDISNDPISGFQRKVDIQSFIWNLGGQSLMLSCLVTFYQNNKPILDERFKPYLVNLLATNIPDEQYPQGEYTWFIDNYAASHIILPELLSSIVILRDQQGRFNA